MEFFCVLLRNGHAELSSCISSSARLIIGDRLAYLLGFAGLSVFRGKLVCTGKLGPKSTDPRQTSSYP
jgi:hypothetical protein